MSIYLRTKYGNNTFAYPLFGGVENYSSFLLRNGGEDYLNIHIFDAALQVALKGQMDIDMQDYRPVAVYINGKYYGLYYLREKVNEDYLESNYGKNNYDMIKGQTTIKAGDMNDYNDLINYVKTHDTTKPDVYEYLKTKVSMVQVLPVQ